MDWIEDPGNANPSYARTSARAMLADPPLDGLTAGRMAATARRLARTADALDHYVAALYDEAVQPVAGGAVRLALAPLWASPEDTALRLLARLLMQVGGNPYPPRMTRTETVLDNIRTHDFRGTASAGCLIRPDGDGHVLVCREAAAVAAPVAIGPGQTLVWDRRFVVSLGPDELPGEIGALGDQGWRWLLANWPDARTHTLPHLVRLAVPALRRKAGLVAVPHLGYDPKTCALTVRSWHDKPTA